METEKKIIEIGNGTIVRILLWLLFLLFLYIVRNVIVIVIFSVVIASAVEPAAQWFSRRKIPRAIGVLMTYILGVAFFAVIFSLVVPSLFSEISNLTSDLPAFIENTTRPGAIAQYVPALPESIGKILSAIGTSLSSSIAGFSGDFFEVASRVFGGALSFLIIVVLSFYLSVQERGIENFLRIVTPMNYEEYVVNLWQRSRRKIGRWFQGQVFLGILVGIMVFLGLTILQVRFALSLAIVAGMFEILPIFGPILAAIPAVIIAFFQEPLLGFLAIALYIIIQQIENNLIYPVVMRKAVGVHPALVILALIIGAQFGGVVGILLAVPIAVVFVEISNDIAAKKHVT